MDISIIAPAGFDPEKEDPVRMDSFKQGAIIAQIQDDDPQWLWSSSGRGCDLLVIALRARNGHTWIMGRARLHRDEKLMGSQDEKVCLRVVLPKEIASDDEVETIVRALVSGYARLGIEFHEVHRTCLKGRGPLGVQEALEGLAMNGTWDTTTIQYDGGPSEGDDVGFAGKGRVK